MRLVMAARTFQEFTGIRIQQGEVSAGPERQSTILGSCVCIGLYDHVKHIGAISHITGFRNEGGHSAEGALTAMAEALRRHGVRARDCECFLIGGSDNARHVYDDALRALRERGVEARPLDVLGVCHRKLVFDPATGMVKLFKKSGAGDAPTDGGSYAQFQDPGKRVTTGASCLFRNAFLLDQLTEVVLPDCAGKGHRFQGWCAGCSTGMEAYSIAMVTLDWLRRNAPAIKCRILGSDISDDALAKAEAGVYPVDQGKRKVFAALLSRYTESIDAHMVRMGQEARKTVIFRRRDILQGSGRHYFDLVVCDHVLQYFGAEAQKELIRALLGGVRRGGYAYIHTPSLIIRRLLEKDLRLDHLGRNFYRRRED